MYPKNERNTPLLFSLGLFVCFFYDFLGVVEAANLGGDTQLWGGRGRKFKQ